MSIIMSNPILLPDGLVQVIDGQLVVPILSFITDPSTGLILNHIKSNIESFGIIVKGNSLITFNTAQINLLQTLKLDFGASDQSILATDPLGNSFWKVANANGTILLNWNSFFAGINFNVPSVISTNVTFPVPFLNIPSVVVSKESAYPISGSNFYVNNKSINGFSVSNNFNNFKTLVNATIGDCSMIQLYNGSTATSYINSTTNLISYVTIDSTFTNVTNAIVLDTLPISVNMCSMCLVGIYPAILYQVKNGSNYEWRYIIANDVNGITWKTPVVVYSATSTVTGLAAILMIINGKPTAFFNISLLYIVTCISTNTTGSSFGAPITIGGSYNNLLQDVQIISGYATMLFKYTNGAIYYVQCTSLDGTQWPNGGTNVSKSSGSVYTDIYKHNAIICFINGIPNIIAIELTTHIIYIATASNTSLSSIGAFVPIATGNVSNANLSTITYNNNTYLLYNSSASIRSIVQISNNGVIGTISVFSNTLNTNAIGDNNNSISVKDNSNIVLMNTGTQLVLTRSFNLTINWTAMD